MDGVSSMAIQACFSDEYNIDQFVKIKKVPFWQQIAVRLMVPFCLPMIIASTAFTSRDKNFFTKSKKKMSGKLNCASSSKMTMKDIKDLSKKMSCTVNDVVMSATSVAFRDFFAEKQ